MKTVKLPKKFLETYPEFKDKVVYVRYVRDGKKRPIGVVLIDTDGNAGYSLLNVQAGDKWDCVKGIRKALYRCQKKMNLSQLLNSVRAKCLNFGLSDLVKLRNAYFYHIHYLGCCVYAVSEYCKRPELTDSL